MGKLVPRALRDLATLPGVRKALADLEAGLGGREVIVEALAHAPQKDGIELLYGLLADPEHARRSLAELCALADVAPGTLIKTFQLAELTRAQAVALRKMTARLPAVVEDLARRAAPYTMPCEVCQGTGTYTPEPTPAVPNPESGPCVACRGAGEHAVLPDLDRQKFVVEMAGMVSKGGGLQIIQNQQMAVLQRGAGSFEPVQAAVHEILNRSGLASRRPTDPVIEAEPSEDLPT